MYVYIYVYIQYKIILHILNLYKEAHISHSYWVSCIVIIVLILSIHPRLKYSHKTAFLVFRSGAFMYGNCILSQSFKLITWLDCMSSLIYRRTVRNGQPLFPIFLIIIIFSLIVTISQQLLCSFLVLRCLLCQLSNVKANITVP